MKIEIECNTLSFAFRTLMLRANITNRELGARIGEHYSTVWRAIRNPSKASAKVLFKLVRELELSWEEFEQLFQSELK